MLSALCSFASVQAALSDLGVYGRVFPVIEQDIRSLLSEQLKGFDEKIWKKQRTAEALRWSQSVPSIALSIPEKTHTLVIDPSIILSRDIQLQGGFLYRKGSRINPLHFIRPSQHWLLFDARSKQQVDFAAHILRYYSGKLLPLVTGGSTVAWSNKWHIPVYYAFPAIVHRFHITESPSLLRAGVGPYRERLLLTAFARKDWNLKAVKRYWNDDDR